MSSGEDAARDLQARVRLQERLGTHPRDWLAWLFDRLALPDNCRVLEVAAGSGDLWARNASRVAPGWRLTLSDASPGTVRMGRASTAGMAAAGENVSWLAADVAALPLPSADWDAVLAVGVFDYLAPPSRAAAFAEIERVLVPGGYLYTVTGGRDHLHELEDLMRPFVPGADYGGDPDAFGVENGAAQLARWFGDVTLERYTEDLVFRSPEPLLQYLLSEMDVRRQLDQAGRAALADYVTHRLAEHGEWRATINKGLLRARKAA